MKDKYMQELICKYKQGRISDADICDNIERLTRKDEFIQDVNSNRIREKIKNQGYVKNVIESPEDTITRKCRLKRMRHFLNWTRKALTPEQWLFFLAHCSEKSKDKKTCSQLYRIRNKIKTLLPYYERQFGKISDLLK